MPSGLNATWLTGRLCPRSTSSGWSTIVIPRLAAIFSIAGAQNLIALAIAAGDPRTP